MGAQQIAPCCTILLPRCDNEPTSDSPILTARKGGLANRRAISRRAKPPWPVHWHPHRLALKSLMESALMRENAIGHPASRVTHDMRRIRFGSRQ